MISKIQTKQLWSEDEHHTALPESFIGGKRWGKWIMQAPVFRYSYHLSEWDRSIIGTRIESQLRAPALDDELFQQAAAKVNHRIQIDRKILGGAPCIAGTRIPVYAILQLVEAGYSHRRVLKSFPSLKQEDLEAALRFSAIVMER
jgi:uncharacterized protein (DUF433 family)